MEVTMMNVVKRFGNFKAVDNLSLTIKDGEFVALLGPSGCGKTTTLLMLAGIYKPDAGEIIFDDKIVNDVLPKDRNIGMCFQSYALYPHMTVEQNIAFPLKLKKLPKKVIDEKVREIAAKFRIEHLLKRYPGQISGGQQQRVALARALIKEPNLLLLDEPLSNLDAGLRISMRAEIKKLQKELGITTVFVTHDQTEALSMSDRIAVMNKGKLQAIGTPEDLYMRPKNMFIAGFIGNPPMNFLEVGYIMDGDRVTLKGKNFEISLPEEISRTFIKKQNNERIVMGIRPEHLSVGAEAPNTIKGEIYVVEHLGKDKLVDVKVGDDRIKVLTGQDFEGKMGDTVNLHLDLKNVHLFDAVDGNSMRRVA